MYAIRWMEFNTAIFCGVKMKQERREKNIPTLKKWVNEWMECETFHILSIVDTKSFFFLAFWISKTNFERIKASIVYYINQSQLVFQSIIIYCVNEWLWITLKIDRFQFHPFCVQPFAWPMYLLNWNMTDRFEGKISSAICFNNNNNNSQISLQFNEFFTLTGYYFHAILLAIHLTTFLFVASIWFPGKVNSSTTKNKLNYTFIFKLKLRWKKKSLIEYNWVLSENHSIKLLHFQWKAWIGRLFFDQK